MFEGNIPEALDSRNSATGEMPEDTLCELQWADLVARLTAARELRAELAACGSSVLASFDADSARHLASQHECHLQGENEPVVNPDDLANRKGHAAQHSPHADRDVDCDNDCDTRATRGNT
ncbi:hypothetical protein [Aurantiacibacter rhizosphaerae]|uniref:Uncharacterized protein n=1 Tax=Aurantiacibacter rhizosphaerae TaxID=2691582 RepID=A0A844X8X3_9SPHN|nr:hypothetical protein [Aurantiacibacter rhizosphaerae]MWV26280.1 hypothetical protein [Aurantiacibacter rhizosphaerae]